MQSKHSNRTTCRARVTWERWMMVFGLGLALLLGASRADAQVASGRVIDLNEDVNGFQLWYSLAGGGTIGLPDDLGMAGSIGQLIAQAPNPYEDLSAVAGFWAPGVSYDTTGVDPSDSTDVDVQMVLDATDGAATEFSLSPVFPNPGRGVEYVGWAMPHAANVRLTVHDVMGREVAVLAEGPYAAGRYSIRWNPARTNGGLSAGMYFVRLDTPAGHFTRRVALIH